MCCEACYLFVHSWTSNREINDEDDEPDGSILENCGIMRVKRITDKSWNDMPCAYFNIYYYMCEYNVGNSNTG